MLRKRFSFLTLLLLLALTAPTFSEEAAAPTLSDPEAWTLVVVPDTQTYVKFIRNQGILHLMTGWIVENAPKERLNILAAVTVGDLVETNNYDKLDPKRMTATGDQQWKAVSQALGKMDDRLLYVPCTGNHDYGFRSAENRETQFGDYFKKERNKHWEKQLVATAPNSFGKATLENAAYEIEAPNWGKFLILALEFTPRDEVLKWALDLISQKKYADHRVIITTHAYLFANGTRIESRSYKTGTNYGKDIWEKLIEPSSNVVLVLCGHVGQPNNFRAHVGFKIDKTSKGRPVAQMLFNAQALAGGWHGNGGEGWLRLLEFQPDGKTVKSKTFSPFFYISPTTRKHAWSKEDFNEFSFELPTIGGAGK